MAPIRIPFPVDDHTRNIIGPFRHHAILKGNRKDFPTNPILIFDRKPSPATNPVRPVRHHSRSKGYRNKVHPDTIPRSLNVLEILSVRSTTRQIKGLSE